MGIGFGTCRQWGSDAEPCAMPIAGMRCWGGDAEPCAMPIVGKGWAGGSSSTVGCREGCGAALRLHTALLSSCSPVPAAFCSLVLLSYGLAAVRICSSSPCRVWGGKSEKKYSTKISLVLCFELRFFFFVALAVLGMHAFFPRGKSPTC